MVEEMHVMLTNTTARPQQGQMKAKRSTGWSQNQVDVTANSPSGSMFDESPSSIAEELRMTTMQSTEQPHDQLDVAAYSLSGSSIGEPSGPIKQHGKGVPSVSIAESTPRRRGLRRHVDLPAATVALNIERRAFGAREYEAFKQRHAQPKKSLKPYFLTSVAPTNQELQDSIPHIFQSTAEGKQQTQELKNEISRWTQEFARFVDDTKATQSNKDGHVLSLLGALNEAVDSSTGKMRKLFYETSDSAGFTSVLNQVETMSKSVRVMKEIEDFQDAKEEWSEQTVR
ncbi:hypothetical protein J4E93_002661 [Alternaria ventricosa]|uniref:uncharacterized protein n=1 Tax=Alternaria ventricosa TaxID=1187951 RepID=UPI0020C51B80|nr:uncharacterized protein J4E93_002661 [Alternaria ventricosa]KAI4652459.1 hypothetical protein J4E93_002661 [Alternaria ventricosa]